MTPYSTDAEVLCDRRSSRRGRCAGWIRPDSGRARPQAGSSPLLSVAGAGLRTRGVRTQGRAAFHPDRGRIEPARMVDQGKREEGPALLPRQRGQRSRSARPGKDSERTLRSRRFSRRLPGLWALRRLPFRRRALSRRPRDLPGGDPQRIRRGPDRPFWRVARIGRRNPAGERTQVRSADRRDAFLSIPAMRVHPRAVLRQEPVRQRPDRLVEVPTLEIPSSSTRSRPRAMATNSSTSSAAGKRSWSSRPRTTTMLTRWG